MTIPRFFVYLAVMVAIGIWLAAGAARADDGLTVITEDYPPLNYLEDGELKGPSVDVVRAIMERLGLEPRIDVYPWARGYKFLETRENIVLFSTSRTKVREDLFRWVGPLAEKRIGLYALKDRNIELETLADTEPYLIGVQRHGVTMQHLAQEGMTNFDASSGSDANLRKLLAGNNDLWFASNSTVAETCKRLNISFDALKLVLEIERTSIHIAFSKPTPDPVIARWQDALDDLVREGVVERIFRGYGMVGMRPSNAGG